MVRFAGAEVIAGVLAPSSDIGIAQGPASAEIIRVAGSDNGRRRTVLTKSCQTCGAEFKSHGPSYRHGKQWQRRKFCSLACVRRPRRPLSYAKYRRVGVGGGQHLCKYEHRAVMEKILGRPLRRREHVHHKNGDKLDNRPENLEVVDASDHIRRHQLGKPKKRRTHCKRGHAFDYFPRGKQQCRTCKRLLYHARRARGARA